MDPVPPSADHALPPLPVGIEQEYQRIRAYPDDDLSRLLYADWLDERGDARGEFIRVQIARARVEPVLDTLATGEVAAGPALLRRLQTECNQLYAELCQWEKRLLAQYRQQWLAPLRGVISGEEFRRGFVESVRITARAFLEHAPRLFAFAPLRHVQILDLDHWAEALANCPFLDRLASLTIYAQHSGPALAAALAGSPYLDHLRRLCLGRNRLGDEGVAHLTKRVWPALEYLDLSDNNLSLTAAELLQKVSCFPRLRFLQLRGNQLGLSGATHLAEPPLRDQLVALGLASNQIGRCGGGDLLSALHRLLAIPRLDLANNGLTPQLLRYLWNPFPSNPDSSRLQVLDLSRNDLGDAGVVFLTQGPGFAQLRILVLAWCNIGDTGACALAESDRFPCLHTLDLSNNPIGEQGFRSFLNTSFLRLRALRRLHRTASALSQRVQQELDQRFPTFPHCGDLFCGSS